MTNPELIHADIIRAKRAEYQAELTRLEDEIIAFRGAIAACDDILKTIEQAKDDKHPDTNL